VGLFPGDRIAEARERLRVIESDIERMQRYIGRLSPTKVES